jgi:regulator of sigma E protease
VVLSVLVFVHEGGHFLVARAFGVRVTEFMLGLPGPNLGFTWHGTKFGVTAVPLGGYAQVCGMVEPESEPKLMARVLDYVYAHGEVALEDVAEDLRIDEEVAYVALEELSEWGSIVRPQRRDRYNIYRTPATQDVPLGTERPLHDAWSFFLDERAQQYSSRPFWKRCLILLAGPGMNLLFAILAFVFVYSIIGVDLQNPNTGEVVHLTLAPWEAIAAGFRYIGMVIIAILGLFNPATIGETISNSTSIVGIAVMSKSALDAGLLNLLMFSALISISLGLMNLLPIPPLDGGRFVIEVVQRLSRRSVPIRIQNAVSIVGMALFMLLFVVMLNQDIQRFVFGNWG